MKSATIEELAYIIKQAKENRQPQPIFFLGAGASKSGNIPLAGDIVTDILDQFQDAPKIKNLPEEDRTYSQLMDCLQPYESAQLLKGYIDKAKINVTHIYLAQLMKHDFVDYVLTVNFDNLMLRALSLFNEFPSTYDMAILKDLTTTTFKEKSVVYLHGQHHGLWLLNTKEEMDKVNTTVPRILDGIKNKRPWVFIGYSGDDPIFEHIKKLGRFDNGLYWITYHDHDPSDRVKSFLETPNTNAHVIKGYDSDSFMLKLNSELGLDQPKIINQPFTSVKEMLENIVDIDNEEHFKGVKERLEIAKEQVKEAIQQFEEGKVASNTEALQEKSKVDLLKKEVIDIIINKDYKADQIDKIELEARKHQDEELNDLLAGLYSDWGVDRGKLAKTKKGEEAEQLYQQAFEKYKKAVKIKPNKYEPFFNWGNNLGKFAEIKEGKKAEQLYQLAFEKYKKAIEIRPDQHDVYNNWGTNLGNFAGIRQGKEAEQLYLQAFEKYKKTIEIKPDKHLTFYNWGADLGSLAKMKEGKETEKLYQQAIEKLKLAIKHGGSSYNLSCIYALKGDKKNALKYLEKSLSTLEIGTDFVLEDEDWKDYWEDKDFIQLLEEYKK